MRDTAGQEMNEESNRTARRVAAVHGNRVIVSDPESELELSKSLSDEHGREGLEQLYAQHLFGVSPEEFAIRRAIMRVLCRRFGSGIIVEPGTHLRNPETFEIGDGVFLGRGAYLQGRHDGRCVIGAGTWLGPGTYLDARDLEIGENVGFGSGARVLGSTHTGDPVNVPIIQTDLDILPVRVADWADIGVGVVILPGVSVGKGSIVGAGAVVTKDVAPFGIVAGVPAQFLRWREGHEPA